MQIFTAKYFLTTINEKKSHSSEFLHSCGITMALHINAITAVPHSGRSRPPCIMEMNIIAALHRDKLFMLSPLAWREHIPAKKGQH